MSVADEARDGRTFRFRASYIAAQRAALTGLMARRDGKPLTACPYNADGTRTEQFLARYWIRGWSRAEPR